MSDRWHADLLSTIGNTPLIQLSRVGAGLPCPILGKVEFFNPGASIKDRIARAMVAQAEAEGKLVPGKSTIVEATAGNTGVGLAILAALRGYRCIFVMPDKMSSEKIRLLRAYGAEVVITATDVAPEAPENYNQVARRLVAETEGAWLADQFRNDFNPRAHEMTTGPEIWRQTGGRVTRFVGGVGTGGTLSGVGRFLKSRNPEIRIVGADPQGSILAGGESGSWLVEGIGEDFIPETFDPAVVDEWLTVSDREAFHTARRVAREEGLLVGGSSGTILAAALRHARGLSPQDLVVAILPDSGRNYLSKMFDDDWMRANGLHAQGGA